MTVNVVQMETHQMDTHRQVSTYNKAGHAVQSNAAGKGCIILLSNTEQCYMMLYNAK